MHTTVQDIRNLLAGLPGDMKVEFSPISMAWLGTSNPMRVSNRYIYNTEGQTADVGDAGACLDIHISEDQSNV